MEEPAGVNRSVLMERIYRVHRIEEDIIKLRRVWKRIGGSFVAEQVSVPGRRSWIGEEEVPTQRPGDAKVGRWTGCIRPVAEIVRFPSSGVLD